MKICGIALGGVAVVFLAAVGLQFVRFRDLAGGDVVRPPVSLRLRERIPQSLPGWSARDEPLGSTEVIRSAVERTLNYDDVAYRIYSRGEYEVGIYVAYWSPGRMPLQKVASHTPDRCWTENGWSCDAMRHHEVLADDRVRLKGAQWRRFAASPNGTPQYVAFWHIVGARLYDYGERFNARPDFAKWWRDTVTYAFAGSDEQYFVRLTSNRPFEELRNDPAWPAIVASLGALGLAD